MSEPRWEGPSFSFSALSEQPWRAEAACRTHPVSDFFPLPFEKEKARLAKAVCAGCPSRAECLDYGIDQADGVFGGFTASERRRLTGRKLRSQDYR